ncbi:MAG: zinc-ribbon domain-containing protein [Candidatus Electrothrix sp. YB6]
MLVICEDCAKKYSIDEARLTSAKAKFSCRACGHIIVVEKPETAAPSLAENKAAGQEQAEKADKNTETVLSSSASSPRANSAHAAAAKGVPLAFYLFVFMLTGFLCISVFFLYLYAGSIPEAINHQLELRGQALAESLKEAVTKPLLGKNYLEVNREVERMSRLPGVAYAAVRNKKGIVVAGFFSHLNRFEPEFARRIKTKGFPSDIFRKNTVRSGRQEGGARISVGGEPVYDQVTALPETMGELHVGIYPEELSRNLIRTLFSLQTLLVMLLFLAAAYAFFILLDKMVTAPIRNLTNIANRISLGEIDLAIISAGPRETRELGTALERMRHAVRVALERSANNV